MKFRRYGVVFLVFIIGMGIFVPVSAKAARKSGMFGYELKGNGTAKITRFYWGANNGADIYVPRFIDGYAVTEIGAFAFSDERIVNVPTSLPAEGMLGEKVIVVLPDTITVIGEKAFFWTQITACNIPSSVHLINAGAFAGCKNIKQFTVDSNNTVYTTIERVSRTP